MEISDYIMSYLEKYKEHPEKVKNLIKFISDFFENLHNEDASIKDSFIEELDEFINDINDQTIAETIKMLKHRDGSESGIKWNKDEVDAIVIQYKIPEKLESYGEAYNKLYFWFDMNYVYAVHYNENREVSGYVELAIDEYCNKNSCWRKYVRKIIGNCHNEK